MGPDNLDVSRLREVWHEPARRRDPKVQSAAASLAATRFLAEIGGRNAAPWLRAGERGHGTFSPALPAPNPLPEPERLPVGRVALVFLPGVMPVPGTFLSEMDALRRDLGVASTTAGTGTFQTPFENAPAVEAALRSAAATSQQIVVLGYSQGAINGLFTLDRLTRAEDPLISRIAAFVTLCGAHHGSPLADLALADPRLINVLPIPLRQLLGLDPDDHDGMFASLLSLSRQRSAGFWSDPDLRLPGHTTWMSWGAISRARDVPAVQMAFYAALRRFGPNDMQVVWRDTVLGDAAGASDAQRVAAEAIVTPPLARTHHWLPLAPGQVPLVEPDKLLFPRLALLRSILATLSDLGAID